jgi:prephenate dehydrogenase
MHLLVVGAGAMGRWFARALTAATDDPVTVTVTDASDDVARSAADALDATAVDPAAATEPEDPFDLVCVAVPIPAATAAITRYAPATDRAVCDLTGTMTDPVAAMREHAPACERVSLHPLFAPENEPGNVAVVPDRAGPVTDAVRAALTRRGNDLFETTPGEHDEAMETVQAKAHTAVLAYALAADDVDERFHTPVSGPLADLAAQVTAGDARVYADIQAAFDGATDVAEAANALAEAEGSAFEALYEDAGR